MTRPVCFFAGWPGAGPCDGALIRAHLIPRQLLKREYPYGMVVVDGVRERALRRERPTRTLRELCEDENGWVPCCGGSMGCSGHHGMLDYSRTLRIPRDRLPAAVEQFAAELGLAWFLDREYGEAVAA